MILHTWQTSHLRVFVNLVRAAELFVWPIWRCLGPVSWICGLAWGETFWFSHCCEMRRMAIVVNLQWSTVLISLFLMTWNLVLLSISFHSKADASYFHQRNHIDCQTHGRWQTSSPAVSFAVVRLSTNKQTAKDKCDAMQAFVLQLYTCMPFTVLHTCLCKPFWTGLIIVVHPLKVHQPKCSSFKK